MNIRLDPEDVLRRLMLVTRGLGFVFLVFFIPAMIRDVLGMALPGGGFLGALQGYPAGPWVPLAISLATLALSAAFVQLHARLPGTREPRPLLQATKRGAGDWLRGFAGGGALATLAFLPLLAAGAVRIEGMRVDLGAQLPVLFVLVILLIVEAAREEMGFRGPALRDLANATIFPLAAVFLAGSFALIHAGNPAATRTGLLGVFAAGMALAGIVRTRGDLWMACGFHAGWNVFVGLVWSLPVSGHVLAGAAMKTTVAKPSWTGGAFGLEAAPSGVAAFALLAAWAWTRRPATRVERAS